MKLETAPMEMNGSLSVGISKIRLKKLIVYPYVCKTKKIKSKICMDFSGYPLILYA